MKTNYTAPIIYGLHAVKTLLLQTPNSVKELHILQERHDQRLQEILTLAKRTHIAIHRTGRKELDEIAQGANHQGVLAYCKESTTQKTNLHQLLDALTVPAFLLILDGVQDPHNLGACIRTAHTAGVHAVIAPKDRAVGMTPAVRKVASGAAEVTPFIQVTNLARTLEELKERGIWIYGAAEEATDSIYATDFSGACAIVLGAEEKGLRRLTREGCDKLISIPTYGSISSLNVSVATGVCLFEAVRQRLGKGAL